jgi:hypothetical protein
LKEYVNLVLGQLIILAPFVIILGSIYLLFAKFSTPPYFVRPCLAKGVGAVDFFLRIIRTLISYSPRLSSYGIRKDSSIDNPNIAVF